MSNGLSITRKSLENKNKIFFCFKNQNGNDVCIKQTVVKTGCGQTRIVIDAPDEVLVLRGELVN